MNKPTRQAQLERKLLEQLEIAELAVFDAVETAIVSGYLSSFVDELGEIERELGYKSAIVKGNLNSWENHAMSLARHNP